jgi:SAM-dependent methyltransferase
MSLVHGTEAPSPWVRQWTHLIAPGGSVLDVACGHGRHMQWLQAQGLKVVGVDRQADAIAQVSTWGEAILADIENGPWPLPGRQFDALVVTNYLWRPLWPRLLESLAPGGVLIYETFATGQETIGKPSRPEFLLRPGELLTLCQSLRVVAFEDGYQPTPPKFVQRIVARRESSDNGLPDRHALSLECEFTHQTG